MRKRSSKEIFSETLLELSQHKTVDKITVQQIVDESGFHHRLRQSVSI